MNEPVTCDIDGFSLLLPAASQLPQIKRDLPHYATNVGRLVRTVAEKYPGSAVLDVGANVGDTLAAIRVYSAAPVLCIEGCAEYLSLLRENVKQFQNVEIEPSFVGAEGPAVAGRVVVEKGTGRLEVEGGGDAIATRTLAEILTSHPAFAHAKLLKIDTDGWDSHIIQRNIATLGTLRPVVFFEYDPHFFTGALADGARVFGALRAAGYHDLLFWENTGDYLLHTTLQQREQLLDLHEAVIGRGTAWYWDIAAFPKEDGDLAQRQRAEELAYFRKARQHA